MNNTKILVIDIETTGFSSKKNKILEIGIVSLDLLNGKIETVFDKLVTEPGLTVDEITSCWFFQNTDVKLKDIMQAKSLESYNSEIQSIIYAYPLGITAFNNLFDFGFMENRGFVFPIKLQDPMKLSKPICNIMGKQGVKNPTSEEAYSHFYKESHTCIHRGADDAYHEAKTIFALYKLGVF